MIDEIAARIDRERVLAAARGRHRWWWWLVGAALAVVGAALGAWYLRSGSRELARLRHERFLADEQARQADVEAREAEDVMSALHAEERARAARQEADAVDLRIHAVRLQYAQDMAAVDRIRSWRDVAADPGDRRPGAGE